MKITFLGTGTSTGVPMIGCDCEVCLSEDPKNKRMRPSILITVNHHNILVDTTPEFRLQAIANGIRRVDAVLFTHSHADHMHGIDDLRIFPKHRKIRSCVTETRLHLLAYGTRLIILLALVITKGYYPT